MKQIQLFSFIFIPLVLMIIFYGQNQINGYIERYEPQSMGSRRYWGWGREYGYSLPEHGEDHGFCIPLEQRRYNYNLRGRGNCPYGYSKHVNNITGYKECCVNYRNY